MIAHIKGTVAGVESGFVIVDVAGVGMFLQVARSEEYAANSQVILHTYLHWTQEQGPSLFGFKSLSEKTIFQLILTCSGVGPKIALAVLRDLSPADVVRSISAHDVKMLSSVNGIGEKKAEQIIVQLKHKIAKLPELNFGVEGAVVNHHRDLTDALASLNYSRVEISRALAHVNEHATGEEYSFDQLFRKALSFLSKR